MDIESILFGSFGGQKTDISPGDILIAQPMMNDFFARSVILMLTADPGKGYMGLVMNHPVSLTMQDILPEWDNGKHIPLHAGGPVDLERLFMLHTLGDVFKGSKEILPGMYIGADLGDVVEFVENGGEVEGHMRFMLGYSGWASNQLDSELLRRTWAVGKKDSTEALLTGDGDDYWRRQVRRLGDSFRSWLMIPNDPSMN